MSNIQIIGWTPSEFEQMALPRINARLGHRRKGMLKNFHCASIGVESLREAIELRDAQEKCYEVAGFLSMDDSGKGRAFKFYIEKGLSWEEAQDLADKLALQVDQCADRMHAEMKRGDKWLAFA
jgi:hypothetical protein